MTANQIIVGSFESVLFPEYQAIGKVRAKIDTGAYTGALHCTKIREVVTSEGTELHFSPFDNPETEMVVKKFKIDEVRSSNGDAEERYFIETKIVILGEEYPITLTLADRSEMRWPVLIGRRFLRKHKILVDVSRNREVS